LTDEHNFRCCFLQGLGPQLQSLLELLDAPDRQRQLGLAEVHVSLATLEEVFLTVVKQVSPSLEVSLVHDTQLWPAQRRCWQLSGVVEAGQWHTPILLQRWLLLNKG
jgi:hypothetical protein